MKATRPNFSHIKIENNDKETLCGRLYTEFQWWETAHKPNDDYYYVNKGKNEKYKVIKTTGWNHPVTGQGFRYVNVCQNCWNKYINHDADRKEDF